LIIRHSEDALGVAKKLDIATADLISTAGVYLTIGSSRRGTGTMTEVDMLRRDDASGFCYGDGGSSGAPVCLGDGGSAGAPYFFGDGGSSG